jgi:hypothetical protein
MSDGLWTAKTEARLRECVGQNMSASQIARLIGCTRNAILGKLWRLGLRADRAATPKSKAKRAHRKSTPAVSLGGVEQEPGPVQAGNLDFKGLAPTSFLDLKVDQCRFIVSDDGRYCPLKRQHGSSYCGFHHRATHAPCGR